MRARVALSFSSSGESTKGCSAGSAACSCVGWRRLCRPRPPPHRVRSATARPRLPPRSHVCAGAHATRCGREPASPRRGRNAADSLAETMPWSLERLTLCERAAAKLPPSGSKLCRLFFRSWCPPGSLWRPCRRGRSAAQEHHSPSICEPRGHAAGETIPKMTSACVAARPEARNDGGRETTRRHRFPRLLRPCERRSPSALVIGSPV